jgi:hypothetical protein
MDEKLREFQVKFVTFYDGTGHRLGPSECTLTSTRLIISDVKGGINQILLRDISGVSIPSRVAAPKMLRISLPGQAYDIDCLSKDQANAVAYWLGQAIRGSLAPETNSAPAEYGSGSEQISSPQVRGSNQEQVPIPQITSRINPAISVILSFFVPGLGTMVNRNVRKGLIILGAYILCLILAVTASVFFVFIQAGIWIYGMVDAYQSS